MPRKRRSRVYWRNQGGVRRAYGDFRDLGGGLEALKPEGEKRAATDPDIAAKLAAERVEALELQKRGRILAGVGTQEDATLVLYTAHHLKAKKATGAVSEQWLKVAKIHLYAAISFFCNGGRELARGPDGRPAFTDTRDRYLASIGTEEVQRYISWLAEKDNGRRGKLSPSTQRKHLNSLSTLYRRAGSEGRVQPGFNPVAALVEKPMDGQGRSESRWLEVHEAAFLLHIASTFKPKREDRAMPPGQLHALLATLLLTGGRPSEVYGLRVGDVSFERRTVTFRWHEDRRLKNRGSIRVVPLWPQLEAILRTYVETLPSDPSGHLFPSSISQPSQWRSDSLRGGSSRDSAAGGGRCNDRHRRPRSHRRRRSASLLQLRRNRHSRAGAGKRACDRVS